MSWKSAQEYLEGLQIQNQHIQFDELLRLFGQRLWHQLTDVLDAFVNSRDVRLILDLLEFYVKFIKPFEERLNQLRLVRIVISISDCVDEKLGTQRLELIKSLVDLPKVVAALDASIVARSKLALMYIDMGNFEEAKVILDQTKKFLNELNTSDTAVYSSFYFACTELNRKKGNPEEYYKNAIQYLEYTDITLIDQNVRVEFAYNFGLSALIGKEIFNYGEILEHPIIEVLRGSNFEWLGESLSIFNRGSIEDWKHFQEVHKDILNSIPELVNNIVLLDQKISIMSIINLFFSLDSKERRLPISSLSTKIEKNIDNVEMLLMKCMSLGFIRGQIDQVSGYVEVEWVQPRVLTLEQINGMGRRFSDWINNVDTILAEMETSLPQSLTS